MTYIDAHCHLLDENEIQLARITGVKNLVCNATGSHDWDKVLALKNVVHAIGIHPWYVSNLADNDLGQLEQRLIQNPQTHIGEIGLDKCKKDFYKQEEIFEAQLKLAQKLNRPVHIHCVRAWQELLAIIKNYPNLTYLFHGFSGDKNVVRFLEKFNAYFSIHSDKKIPLIPDDRLLIESDAPDGLPSPANLPFLYMQLGINPEKINQNFKDFLNGK